MNRLIRIAAPALRAEGLQVREIPPGDGTRDLPAAGARRLGTGRGLAGQAGGAGRDARSGPGTGPLPDGARLAGLAAAGSGTAGGPRP